MRPVEGTAKTMNGLDMATSLGRSRKRQKASVPARERGRPSRRQGAAGGPRPGPELHAGPDVREKQRCVLHVSGTTGRCPAQ